MARKLIRNTFEYSIVPTSVSHTSSEIFGVK